MRRNHDTHERLSRRARSRSAALCLLAVCAFAPAVLAGCSKESAAAPEQESSAPDGAAASRGFYALDPLIVNLNDPSGLRYLKVSVSVGVASSAAKDNLARRLPEVRDRLITYLSSLTFEDTRGAAGKEKIRAAARQRIERLLGPGAITDVFFTEFILQ